MRYRIDLNVCGHEMSVSCRDRKEMLHRISIYKMSETIVDIRKLYKSGVSDSVMEKYTRFFDNGLCQEVRHE